MASTVFIDVPETNEFRPLIESMFFAGITIGKGGSIPYVDLLFKPSDVITVGEFVTWCVRAMKVKVDPSVEPDNRMPQMFTDCAQEHTFFPHMQKAAKMGIFCGPDRTSNPPDFTAGLCRVAETILRKQAACFVVRARDYELINPATASFSDVPTSHPYYKEIETAYAKGFTRGFGPGTFQPDTTSTREQMSKFIVLGFDIPLTLPYNFAPPEG